MGLFSAKTKEDVRNCQHGLEGGAGKVSGFSGGGAQPSSK